mgnify:CR=1 FL=1
MKTINLFIICVCVTLLIAGVLFWPTLYRYDKIGNSIPFRINRLTGYTEYFADGKWNPEEGHEKLTIQTLPIDEKVKVTGNASFAYGYKPESFSGKIYNGSDWTITKFILRIVAKEKDDSIRWDRKFSESKTIKPLSTSSFSISVTGTEDVSSCDWYIVEVLGYKGKQ